MRTGLKFDGICDVCGKQKCVVMTGNSHWGPVKADEENCLCDLAGKPLEEAAPRGLNTLGPAPKPKPPAAADPKPETADIEALEEQKARLKSGLGFLGLF